MLKVVSSSSFHPFFWIFVCRRNKEHSVFYVFKTPKFIVIWLLLISQIYLNINQMLLNSR